MIDELHVRRRFGPGFGKQPNPSPESSPAQQPSQPTHAQPQHTDDSSRSARCTAMSVRQLLWRRSETTGRFAHADSVLDSATIGQRPQCRYRQHQPMTTDSFRVFPSGLIPPEAYRFQRSEAHLYPEPKSIPAHPCLSRRKVGHHYRRLTLFCVPDHYHRPATPFGWVSERGSAANVGVSGTGRQHASRKTSSSVRTKHRVDGLANIRMPSQRDYLIPQTPTPQPPIAHHHNHHLLRNRLRNCPQHIRYRTYPPAGSIGRQNVPGNRNRATTIDHAYHQRVYPVSLHRRVYGQRQSVRLPKGHNPSHQRCETPTHIQLCQAGIGTVCSIIKPLSEVLTHGVEAGHERQSHSNRALTSTACQYSAAHPQGQSLRLGLSEVGHVVLYGLVHLITFGWEAHGDLWQPFCLITKRCHTTMRFPSSHTFFTLCLPLSAPSGRGNHGRPLWTLLWVRSVYSI